MNDPRSHPFIRLAATLAFGKPGAAALAERRCPSCKAPIQDTAFCNEISQREFGISGLCQSCQDSVFGKD